MHKKIGLPIPVPNAMESELPPTPAVPFALLTVGDTVVIHVEHRLVRARTVIQNPLTGEWYLDKRDDEGNRLVATIDNVAEIKQIRQIT